MELNNILKLIDFKDEIKFSLINEKQVDDDFGIAIYERHPRHDHEFIDFFQYIKRDDKDECWVGLKIRINSNYISQILHKINQHIDNKELLRDFEACDNKESFYNWDIDVNTSIDFIKEDDDFYLLIRKNSIN